MTSKEVWTRGDSRSTFDAAPRCRWRFDRRNGDEHDALSPAVSNRHPDAGSNRRSRARRPGTERGRSWDDPRCRVKQPHGLHLRQR